MADTDPRPSSSDRNLLPSPRSTHTPGSSSSPHPDGLAHQSHYDRWLRPRPNNQWQKLENQTFVDHTQFKSVPFEEDEDASGDEDGELDSSDELSDAEESDSEAGDEPDQVEDEAEERHNLPCSGRPRVADEEVSKADVNSEGRPTAPRGEEAPHRRLEDERSGYVEQDDGIISRFLRVMEDQDLHRDSIARLGNFLKAVTLGRLEEGSKLAKGSRILLEDRNFTGKSFRPYPRSLTPKQLYEALRKERYPAIISSKPVGAKTSTQNWGHTLRSGLSLLLSTINGRQWSFKVPDVEPRTASPSDNIGDMPKWIKSKDCQVERRTLYVSNPNKYTALALAATASPTQAPVLFDFIDRYLKFETSISVDPNPHIARMTLRLHLPFYTFRDQVCMDTRKDHHGAPLRRCFEIPCMSSFGTPQDVPKPRGWICKSQVSVVISVIDLHGWTAYAFEDTYYRTRESSQDFDFYCSVPGFYFPDALTAGALDSTRFLEPRAYFLMVFQSRIEQAYLEWQIVVGKLEENVKSHRPGDIFYPPSGPTTRRKSKRDKQISIQQRYAEWISNMNVCVSDLSGQLSTTLTAWDEFEKRCSRYFPEDCRSLLDTNIGHTFSEIKLLKDRLDGLGQEISRDQSTLGALLAVENTGTAKFVKALTVISIVMMPMVLDIALFSIQPGVMPFRMDFLAFVKSYFALALFFCVVWVIVEHGDIVLMLISFTFERMDGAAEVPSGSMSNPIHEQHVTETSGSSTGLEGDTQMDGLASASGKSVWRRFHVNFLLRRGQRGKPTEELEPAGLAGVVCV